MNTFVLYVSGSVLYITFAGNIQKSFACSPHLTHLWFGIQLCDQCYSTTFRGPVGQQASLYLVCVCFLALYKVSVLFYLDSQHMIITYYSCFF